jgi:hypothetical protein
MGLEGPFNVFPAVTLSDIRGNTTILRDAKSEIEVRTKGLAYIPFELPLKPRRETQPIPAYLGKLPFSFDQQFAGMREARVLAVGSGPSSFAGELGRIKETGGWIGENYEEADEQASRDIDPYVADPSIVDRGVRGHARTQNALASFVRASGLQPFRPKAGEPLYDLAWHGNDRLFVAEIKSLTVENEERQLRSGLGQVLRYQQRLARRGLMVIPVLAVERRPADPTWADLCAQHGVLLVWPSTFESLA